MYLFLIAGATYLGGVLGMELVGSSYIFNYGPSLSYGIVATIEEVLEMLGIIVFIYALLDYLETHVESMLIRFVSR